MGDCPTCLGFVADDAVCTGCGRQPDAPASVRASRMTLSTPWGLRRRRRSVAREVQAAAAVESPGLVGALEPIAFDGGEGSHHCRYCGDTKSIFGPFPG